MKACLVAATGKVWPKCARASPTARDLLSKVGCLATSMSAMAEMQDYVAPDTSSVKDARRVWLAMIRCFPPDVWAHLANYLG